MANDFYQATGSPSTRSSGSSSTMRAEFAAIEDAFDKLAPLAAHALEILRINTGATGHESITPTQLLAALQAVLTTQAAGNNTTNFATTAFVQRALGNFRGIKAVNAPYTLTADDAGYIIFVNNTGTITWPDSTIAAGNSLVIAPSGSDTTVTLSRPSGVFAYAGASASTVVLKGDEAVTLLSQGGVLVPEVIAGGLGSAPVFTFLSAINGHQQWPTRIKLQWGKITTSASADVSVTLPKAFSVALYACGGTIISSVVGYGVSTNSHSTTGFNIGTYSSGTTRAAASTFWWAIGE